MDRIEFDNMQVYIGVYSLKAHKQTYTRKIKPSIATVKNPEKNI